MKKFAGIIFVSLTLCGCKVTTNSPGAGGGGDGGGGQVEKGGSVSGASKYFSADPGPISSNNLDGLWRQRESDTSQGYARKEAMMFKGASTMIFAVECHKLGMTVFSMVRVPIQIVRNQITVTKGGGYQATEKDEKSGTSLTCPAIVRKGDMFYSFKDYQTLCLSSAADCKGRKTELLKVRDEL